MVGRHVLRATLNASNTSTSASVAVSSMGTILSIPGGISLVHPTSGAVLNGTVTVTGAVSGVSASSVAPLFATLGQEVTVAFLDVPTLSDTFSSGGYEDGTTSMQLTSSGFDLASTPVTVILKNAAVKMTAPAAGATVSGPVTLAATATADGGNLVEQVRWYVDGSFIGSDSSAPFALSWGAASVPNGTHILRADAILTDGRTLSSANQSVVVKVGAVTRLAGPDRYSTAVAISKASFAPGVPVAYIATGLGFADALAGAAVAGHVGGPILLVPGTSIPAVVAAELTRLKPARIVVLGGTGVVSDGVKAALVAYVGP
jgi:hypothetical protein